jgi:hypothetical protein
MSQDMLGSLVRVLVTVPEDRLGLVRDFAHKLAGSDGDTWVKQGKSFLRKELCWTPSILELVGAVRVPATTGKFVAKEKFVCDTGHKAKVKISYLDDNFTAWFLSGDGKTENPISGQTLRYHKLRKPSVNGPIINELGGDAKTETTLSEMFFLMEEQKNGESGSLLNNGYTNIFYIRDQKGVPRAVRVYWYDVGWHIRAHSALDPDGWDDGDQVFSRNLIQ